jgi:hypothetical protein
MRRSIVLILLLQLLFPGLSYYTKELYGLDDSTEVLPLNAPLLCVDYLFPN